MTIVRQCELLEVCRSSLYYRPPPVSAADLALMRRLDELHLNYPFLGARRLAHMLQREGLAVGRRHVGTLMWRMGIEAIYRKRRTSMAAEGHKIYPYLLANVAIERPNQGWAADLTYGTPRQRSPPGRGPSCLSMSGMHRSLELMLQ
jgi:putative transposase